MVVRRLRALTRGYVNGKVVGAPVRGEAGKGCWSAQGGKLRGGSFVPPRDPNYIECNVSTLLVPRSPTRPALFSLFFASSRPPRSPDSLRPAARRDRRGPLVEDGSRTTLSHQRPGVVSRPSALPSLSHPSPAPTAGSDPASKLLPPARPPPGQNPRGRSRISVARRST